MTYTSKAKGKELSASVTTARPDEVEEVIDVCQEQNSKGDDFSSVIVIASPHVNWIALRILTLAFVIDPDAMAALARAQQNPDLILEQFDEERSCAFAQLRTAFDVMYAFDEESFRLLKAAIEAGIDVFAVDGSPTGEPSVLAIQRRVTVAHLDTWSSSHFKTGLCGRIEDDLLYRLDTLPVARLDAKDENDDDPPTSSSPVRRPTPTPSPRWRF